MINIFYSLIFSYTFFSKSTQLSPLIPITLKRFNQINVKDSNLFDEDRSLIVSKKLENFQKERDKMKKSNINDEKNKDKNQINLQYKRGDEPDN